MKLSFSTLGCPNWTFDEIIVGARDMGFDAVELRGVQNNMRADEIEALFPANRNETKRRLSDAGVKLCGFGTSVRFDQPDQLSQNLDEGYRAIDVCAEMDIPFIRVFGDSIDLADEEASIGAAAAGIRDLCAYAKDTNVRVLLEVHGDYNRLERLQMLDRQIARDEFGILWDIQHSDRVYGDGFAAFYEPLKHKIAHVHVKDHLRADGAYKPVSTGEGDIPIGAIVRTMARDGYDGYFSFEWEKRWEPRLAEPEAVFPKYVRYMRALEGVGE